MWSAALVTCVLTAALTPLLARWARRRNYLDLPNDRSSHTTATPRIGGVAIVAAVFAGVLVLHVLGLPVEHNTAIVLVGSLAIAILGLADDFRQLPAIARLIVQAAIASVVVASVGPVALPIVPAGSWIAALVTVFWIVTLTNAYNFMDGIDGIAGVQALVGGVGWILVGMMAASQDIQSVGALLAAASAGFLLHNWQPARVFMGDAGSGFLGFLLAALPLIEPQRHTVTWWCAVLLMWPFLFDTGFTLVRRARRRENLLSAHRSHLYQRLVLTGVCHSRVSLLYGGLALLGLSAAVAAQAHHPVIAPAFAVVIVLVACALWLAVSQRETA